MILLVQIICLCYTLYVLQEYATSGAYSRQHRLLPLLVGLIGVYNFYQVVLTLTGQTELFGRLKDMLLIQVLYLILIYIMDFLKIHIPYGVQWIMFCVLLALNVIVFMRYRQPEIYHIYFRIYLIGCTAAIVAMGTYAYLRRSLTMHEHQIANLLYIVLLVNAAAMCAEKFFTIPGNLLMLAATTGVCGAVHYLIQTDQLMDTGELLRERLYDDSDTAVVLLDTNFYCVDANRSGRSLFAGPMQLYERQPQAPRIHAGGGGTGEVHTGGKKEPGDREERTVLSVSVYAGVLFRETPWIYSRCLGYYQPEKRDAADAGIKGKSRDADGAEK